jgi:hypothetical protein
MLDVAHWLNDFEAPSLVSDLNDMLPCTQRGTRFQAAIRY